HPSHQSYPPPAAAALNRCSAVMGGGFRGLVVPGPGMTRDQETTGRAARRAATRSPNSLVEISFTSEPGRLRSGVVKPSANTLCMASHRLRASPTMPKLNSSIIATEPIIERSEEHTSELQSRENLVCRLLLEKKKTNPSSYIK